MTLALLIVALSLMPITSTIRNEGNDANGKDVEHHRNAEQMWGAVEQPGYPLRRAIGGLQPIRNDDAESPPRTS